MIKELEDILNKNEIRCLEFFIHSGSEEFTAKEISKKLNISLSRIYPLLNRLCNLGFVTKKLDKNIKFSMGDPENAFRKFFNEKYEQLRNAEDMLYSNVIQKSNCKRSDIIFLQSNEEVGRGVYQILINAKTIKSYAKTPMMLIPAERQGFWRKKMYELCRNKIQSGTPFHYMIDSSAVNRLINKKNSKEVRNSLKWLEKHPNVKIRDIHGKGMASIVLTENEAILAMHYPPLGPKTRSAIVFRSKEIVNFFTSIYDEIFLKGVEVSNL